MIKKVIILSIVGTFLLGLGAPLLGMMQYMPSQCGMQNKSCCDMATPSHSTDDAIDSENTSCPVMGASCLPVPVPEPLNILSDAPVYRIQFKFFQVETDLGSASTIDVSTQNLFLFFYTDPPLLYSKDILLESSVLLI